MLKITDNKAKCNRLYNLLHFWFFNLDRKTGEISLDMSFAVKIKYNSKTEHEKNGEPFFLKKISKKYPVGVDFMRV